MRHRHWFAALVLVLVSACGAAALQQDSFSRKFRPFKNAVPGVDFYGESRESIAPFLAPVREAYTRLQPYLGDSLARGAVVICSTAEQRDSVSEARLLKLGYRWALIQMTPEAVNQQIMAQIQARSGGQVSPQLLERFRNRSPEMKAAAEARVVAQLVQRAAFAVISTTLDPELNFRASRLDDLGRSPLADWLDVGLASTAAGPASVNLRFLQEHIEEVFPMEDVLTMARPFVAPSVEGGSGGGPVTVVRTAPGGPEGGAQNGGSGQGGAPGLNVVMGGVPAGGAGGQGGGGGRRMGGGGPMPKDVQDRMLFDTQAATVFQFLQERLGKDKMVQLVRANREGKEVPEILQQPGFLGSAFEQLEQNWDAWVKTQKPRGPGPARMTTTAPGNPARQPVP